MCKVSLFSSCFPCKTFPLSTLHSYSPPSWREAAPPLLCFPSLSIPMSSCEPDKKEDEDDIKIDGGEDGKKKDKADNKIIDRIHEELEEIECYHGSLLEEEVKGILPRRGDFILRLKLNTDGSKDIYVAINWNDEIQNIKLKAKMWAGGKGKDLMYSFDKKTRKDTIRSLLQKHQMGTPIEDDNIKMNVMLLNPIAKQAWELRKESVETMKKLGEGAFGEVWSGRLKMRLGKAINVAVKVIKKTTNNEKATTELQKEGSLMRKFSHPNVVRTFGMVIERDTIMVVMELINGGGLNDYVKKNKGTVSMEEKGSYALDLANGLAYIHSLNCIHRDIACRNCLIDIGKKQAKVSDFGLTRQTDVYKVQACDKLPIRWIAPEVLKSYEYTRAADIYAFGILVWEIVNDGETPFGTMNNAQIKEGIQGDLRPPTPDDLPPEILETMKKCWAGDVSTRPQLSEVKRMLGRFRGAVGSETGSEVPVPPAVDQPAGKGPIKKKEESVKRVAGKGKKSKDKVSMKSTKSRKK